MKKQTNNDESKQLLHNWNKVFLLPLSLSPPPPSPFNKKTPTNPLLFTMGACLSVSRGRSRSVWEAGNRVPPCCEGGGRKFFRFSVFCRRRR